jgi:hypothetical protein
VSQQDMNKSRHCVHLTDDQLNVLKRALDLSVEKFEDLIKAHKKAASYGWPWPESELKKHEKDLKDAKNLLADVLRATGGNP